MSQAEQRIVCLFREVQKLQSQHKFTEAVLQAVELVKLSRELKGRQHVDHCVALQLLSRNLISLNRPEDAIRHCRFVAEAYMKIHGQMHLVTAAAMNDLAMCLFHIGEIDQASTMYLKTINVYRVCLGQKFRENLQAATVLFNAATCLGRSGEVNDFQFYCTTFFHLHFILSLGSTSKCKCAGV